VVHAPAALWRRLALPLAVTLLVQITVNVALLSVAVLAPVIAPDLGVPTARAGLFIGLAYLAGAITSSRAGRLLAPIGPMTGSLVALAAVVAGLLAAGAGALAAMAASAVLLGFAYGLTTPTSSEILAAFAPPALYGRVFSIKQTAVPGGGFLAGWLAPPLAVAYGWQGALHVLALAATVLLVLFIPLRRRLDAARTSRRPGLGSPVRLVLARPRLRRLAMAGFALAAVQLSLSTFYTAYLVDGLGLALAVGGALFGLVQVMGVPARVLWGWLADGVFGLERALAILAGLTASGLALTALAEPGWPLWALGLLGVHLGLSVMAWTGLYLAAAVAAAPEDASAVSAGAMVFTFAGVVVGPPLFGLVVERFGGYGAGFAAAAAVATAALVLLAWRRPAGEETDDGDPRDRG
jgi:predicted MFS family arabinose efflux permease